MLPKHPRASFSYGRITRANRIARTRGSAAPDGAPIPCPRAGCGCIVPASIVAGTEEYWCHNNNHGRIAMRIDGKLEYMPEADRGLRPRPRQRGRKYVPCASPGCSSQRRNTCSRVLCWSHCVRLAGPCGCREHDRERERRAFAGDRVGPGRAEPSQPAPIHVLCSPTPPRASRSSHRGHIACTPSPPRRASTSPPPAVPEWVEVSMSFVDTGFRTQVRVPRQDAGFFLHSMGPDASERLHMHETTYGSLRYLDLDGTWREPGFNTNIPYFHDLGDDDAVYIYFRAESNPTGSAATYYSDLAARVQAYRRFTADRKHPMADEDAFAALFDFEPAPADLERVNMCLTVVETSPPQLREKFEHAGRTPKGTWSEFIRECERHEDTPAATRILCRSPLLRQGVQGPPREPSRMRAASLSPDLGASPEPSSPGQPAWRGPPASEASSSQDAALADHDLYDDDLYD